MNLLLQLSGAPQDAQLRALLSITAPYHPLMESFGAAEQEHLTTRLAPTLAALTTTLAELPAEMLADPESAFLPRVEEILALCQAAPQMVMDGVVEVIA